MAPDVPKIDADRHLNYGPPDGYFCDELMRWFFHGNSPSERPTHPIYRQVHSVAVVVAETPFS